MFSLLLYFVRNDKNKDDQSINQSINQSAKKVICDCDNGPSPIQYQASQ